MYVHNKITALCYPENDFTILQVTEYDFYVTIPMPYLMCFSEISQVLSPVLALVRQFPIFTLSIHLNSNSVCSALASVSCAPYVM